MLHELQGNVGARRARYEAGWHTFVTAIAAGKTGLRYSEVPWPAEDPEDAKAILLYGTADPAEVNSNGAHSLPTLLSCACQNGTVLYIPLPAKQVQARTAGCAMSGCNQAGKAKQMERSQLAPDSICTGAKEDPAGAAAMA